MTDLRALVSVSLAAAALVVWLGTVALGGALQARLAPWPGIAVLVMSIAAVALAEGRASLIVASLLTASGIVVIGYAVLRTEFLTAVTFPGPVFGILIGIPVLVLGLVKGIEARRTT